jgi:NAD(P)H-dependent flavin oxidoreductase YrpB (nitropropane dioxygenase family)
MLKTRICDLFGIETPIFCAAMGGVALGELAAAVSEAGAFGSLSSAGFGVGGVMREIGEARRLTRKPFAVGLLIPLLGEGVFEAVLEARVPAIIFFWGDAAPFIPRCKEAGIKSIVQVGSATEAIAAKQAGTDAIIAQPRGRRSRARHSQHLRADPCGARCDRRPPANRRRRYRRRPRTRGGTRAWR